MNRNPIAASGAAIIPRRLVCAIAVLVTAIAWTRPETTAQAQVRSAVSVHCPADIVAEADAASGAAVNFSPTAGSTAGSITRIICSPPSGTVFPIGTTKLNCTATDTLRNTASCSFTVTVRDTTPPALFVPGSVTATCATAGGAPVEYLARAGDAVSQATLTCDPPSGSVFPVGTNIVTCVATDRAGNSRTNRFPVVVTPECADCLSLTVPSGPLTVDAGEDGTRVVYFSLAATNTCGGEAWSRAEPPSGTAFPMGKTVVQCVGGIGSSILVQKSFEIIVRDVTPPSIKIPGHLEYECGGFDLSHMAAKEVWYPNIKVHDNADLNPDLILIPPTGSTMGLGDHTVTAIAKDYSGNSTTNTFVVTVVAGPKCTVDLSGPPDAIPPNWDFELGLIGWSSTGTAFDNQPTFGENIVAKRVQSIRQYMETHIGGDYWHGVTYPIGIHKQRWVGTAENRQEVIELQGGTQGDGPTGTLRSSPFIIDNYYVSFLLGGTTNLDERVELLVETGKDKPGAEKVGARYYIVAQKQYPSGSELLERRWFTVSQYNGLHAVIRIVDGSSSSHINVDDFRFVNTLPENQTVWVAGQYWRAVVEQDGRYYDWDAPVWGFADLHTHPMSHLGFRGKIMSGEPDGDIRFALGDCKCIHAGKNFLDNDCGDYVRQLLMAVMDGAGPNPHTEGWTSDEWKRFRNYPVFTTKTHQQMWHEWIRRAYQGGLRVMIALCVNSQLLGHAAKGDLPELDKEVGDSQIKALKEFVSRHSDFMEIALDPPQLRRIVRSNKLAIIIGSELDDIGNFAHDPSIDPNDPSEAAKKKMSDELDRLYAQGLRYIFPAHLINNKLGGTAIAGDMLNMANMYVHHKPFEVESADVYQLIDSRLSDFDFTKDLNELVDGLAKFAPAAPIALPLLAPVADVLLSQQLGPVPPGTGAAIGAGLAAVGVMAAFGADVMGMAGLDSIPPYVWPLNGNYPKPPYATYGHRNKMGLTALGDYAVTEMMKRGLMLDIDHMSRYMSAAVLNLAEEVPGGYPLNSGHNSFGELHKVDEHAENDRSRDEIARVRELGGLMGVGWENHEGWSFESTYAEKPWLTHDYSSSNVRNNCGGTSKTWAQDYLLALEVLHGKQVCFGTDINGIIVGPGPRFGGQAAFAEEGYGQRHPQVMAQQNGVRYEPQFGRPLTSSEFLGRAVDPAGDPWTPARYELGYSYTADQRDFMVALNIFFWKPTATDAQIAVITQSLHDEHPYKPAVAAYATALVASHAGVGLDKIASFYNLGWAVHQYRNGNGGVVSQDFMKDSAVKQRFSRLLRVWDEYQRIFGNNVPLKRGETALKQWDINFQGVAHYGMLPDFLQDLSNVGLNAEDMSPIFRSAEDFARMWTRCLRGSYNLTHPPIKMTPEPDGPRRAWCLGWFGDIGDAVEETDTLNGDGPWRPFDGTIEAQGHRMIARPNEPFSSSSRFYRVRKP